MASNKIKIGQYNVLQTLGVGSFGKVKLAVHTITGHKVAMKFINRRKIAHLDMVGRVKREIQYLKFLRHPHIIKLYEVITMPTDIIMVMEYARGELFNLIVEKGKMCEDDARRFFQQIICAVEYCHRHKIVHRDLKPENLLLDPYNNVKIADFGLSNIMTDGDFLKTSCGSPNYAAPEVISGRLYAGPEVDVWSCGVILFVMLCGRLPFDDEYIPTLFKKINGGIYTLPSFISVEAKYLLNSMLIVDPLKRITIQEIRQTSWFNVGLPDYLKPLPDSEEVFFDEIDDSIVSEIHKKMGFSKDTIYQALQEIENNQIKVAYQLVVDHKRMITAGRISGQKNMQSFLAASPSWDTLQYSRRKVNVDEDDDEPSSIDGNVEDNEPSSIALLSSSLPPVEEFLKDSQISSLSNPIPITTRRTKLRSKWHFGIRSQNPPLEVMLEIYRGLKNIGMEWKTIDPFRVRSRYIYPSGLQVKIDLQLYRLDTNNYLVDFKNVGYELPSVSESTSSTSSSFESQAESFISSNQQDNVSSSSIEGKQGETPIPSNILQVDGKEVTSMYPFFDVCTKLITELAIST
ncbi:kinase-like domain-containing protein [Gigaspora rosea]|uniref:non-specific serine/threonine protein kinase n=1 Tax=Gigaspora rosea TaxID=44941 RepID=A0A397U716_9GLOM|nr:kinase-like domain-containing protein [Gigaspora rosea]